MHRPLPPCHTSRHAGKRPPHNSCAALLQPQDAGGTGCRRWKPQARCSTAAASQSSEGLHHRGCEEGAAGGQVGRQWHAHPRPRGRIIAAGKAGAGWSMMLRHMCPVQQQDCMIRVRCNSTCRTETCVDRCVVVPLTHAPPNTCTPSGSPLKAVVVLVAVCLHAANDPQRALRKRGGSIGPGLLHRCLRHPGVEARVKGFHCMAGSRGSVEQG